VGFSASQQFWPVTSTIRVEASAILASDKQSSATHEPSYHFLMKIMYSTTAYETQNLREKVYVLYMFSYIR
jgi:hypothetical protein